MLVISYYYTTNDGLHTWWSTYMIVNSTKFSAQMKQSGIHKIVGQ